MSITKALALAGAMVLLAVGQAIADPGNGAVVTRDSGEVLWGFWEWDGEDMFALFASSETGWEEALCGAAAGGYLPYYAMYVERPDGSVKYLEHDSLYVRVFAPATPDDFFADPCGFLATESPVAEGLVKFHSVDNDLNVSGHRINTWGYNVNGPVYDLMGLCPNEIMQLKVVRKFSIPKNADFPDCLPDCVKTKVSRGPRLTCKAY